MKYSWASNRHGKNEDTTYKQKVSTRLSSARKPSFSRYLLIIERMDWSFTSSCLRSVLFVEILWWAKWNVNVFTGRANRSTHIDSLTNRKEHSGSRLQRWEYAWAFVDPLDCRFQPFIGSTSPLFHSMFPCQRDGRRGWKLKYCSIFGALWVDLGRRCSRGRFGSACGIGIYWLSPEMRGWAITLREQAFKWSQQARFLRLLSWR